MQNAELLKTLFGTDVNDIEGHETQYPETVPGRVLHIDADFLAYHVTFDDETPLHDMMYNHDVIVERLRLLAGAETVSLHLTDRESCKGNRYELAIQREYQANRQDKIKPEQLETIKKWMVKERQAINHTEQEADDGLSQGNYSAVISGNTELSVIASKDKDLNMVPGLHLNWETGELELVEGFGYCYLDKSKSTAKMWGKGTAYFWCQMLTGDGADNIQGLPDVSGDVLNAVKPTKTIEKAIETLKNPKATEKQIAKANKTLLERKPAKCGPALAALLMQNIEDDLQAFNMVSALYRDYGERVGFTHWKTGETVPWGQVFLSEAQLLWMRREPGQLDVMKFFKEINPCGS